MKRVYVVTMDIPDAVEEASKRLDPENDRYDPSSVAQYLARGYNFDTVSYGVIRVSADEVTDMVEELNRLLEEDKVYHAENELIEEIVNREGL